MKTLGIVVCTAVSLGLVGAASACGASASASSKFQRFAQSSSGAAVEQSPGEAREQTLDATRPAAPGGAVGPATTGSGAMHDGMPAGGTRGDGVRGDGMRGDAATPGHTTMPGSGTAPGGATAR